MAKRMRSVACRQVAVSDREVLGCGWGWIEDDEGVPVCKDCGRVAFVTGRWIEIDVNQ